MWTITNTTPFAAAGILTRDIDGAELWVVAVKASFLIAPDGSTRIADAQEPIVDEPKYTGAPATSSLRADIDFLPHKTRTDVLLSGSAHQPRGRPAPIAEVHLAIGTLTKRLRVSGDRRWQRSGVSLAPSAAEPFTTMSLTYENAFGGIDRDGSSATTLICEPRNPIGKGFVGPSRSAVGVPLPNVEYIHEQIGSWKQRPRPAALGPIPPNWLPRSAFTGTFDERWEQHRLPLLPEDFDQRFHQCAPEDQQYPGFMRGDEPVSIRGMTFAPDLTFRLPRFAFDFITQVSRSTRHHAAHLGTFAIDLHEMRASLTWCTSVRCPGNGLKVEGTIIREKEVW